MNAVSSLLLGSILPALALAQERMDPSRMVPIHAEPRHAGVVNVTTGHWTRPAEAATEKAGGLQVVYRNNCTWQTAGYYAASEPCEDMYDEGRVPSPSDPSAPSGAAVFNTMRSFEISYCTQAGSVAGTGGYDIDVAFFDSLGGNCLGNVAPTPPPLQSSATAFFSLAGLGLPGSTGSGFQACWIVGVDVSNSGWVMTSDGDGVFDNDQALDSFTWMQRQNTFASPLGYPSATPDGFPMAGDPVNTPYGACSYTIPCGFNGLFGSTCGTGLDTFDMYWVNVDGIAVADASGATPAGCPNAISQYGFGTNCYFFGGFPSNPLASYWLTLEAERPSSSCGQANSCSSNPVVQELTTNPGTYSPGVGESWTLTALPVPAEPNPGILIYGTTGVLTSPILTSFGQLCLSPIFRADSTVTQPVSSSGGCMNPSSYAWDFGAFVDANAGLNGLVQGNVIHLQGWYRDLGNPGGANFTGVSSGVTLQ